MLLLLNTVARLAADNSLECGLPAPYNAGMIFIGTAGWSYPDWEGIAYPKTKSAERLRTMARYLDCVEVDSSFYRPPTARMTAGWARATPPEFRFLAKAWQRFTHERDSMWSQAEFD